VHARSIFLQGLLLSPANQLAARMDPVRSALEKFDIAFAGHGLTRLEGLLASVLAHPEIDRLVVGVTSAAELGAIVAAADRAAKAPPVQLAVEALDPRYLNPARWHELG
jgi:hypothetical protein